MELFLRLSGTIKLLWGIKMDLGWQKIGVKIPGSIMNLVFGDFA
jgi:hypothetical protein